MDWPRAERILIVVFACLNLFLAWELWGEPSRIVGRWFFRNPEEVRAVQDQFRRSGINVPFPLPPSPNSAPFLRVGRPIFSEGDVIRAFFAQSPAVTPLAAKGEISGNRYVDSSRELTVTSRGLIIYTQKEAKTGEAKPASPPPEGKARQMAEIFLRKLGWLPTDARFDGAYAGPAPGQISLRYYQESGGQPFFGSRVNLVFGAGPEGPELVSLERIWMVPQGLGSDKRSLISASSALLGLAGHLESLGQRGLAVESVILGYFSPPYDSDTWEAAPVWRIRAVDGRDFFINALTGELEQQ